MAGNQGNNRIIWEEWQLDFLKSNFSVMTAHELSISIGIKRTKVREMYYSLGLKKMELQFWTSQQIDFLTKNYQKKGDCELAEIFTKKWEKAKGWDKKHIEKKRRYLNLKRTPEEISTIRNRNIKNGRFALCPVHAWITRGGAAPEGTIRYWQDIPMIKINNRFLHWARYTWQLQNGKINSGKVVVFKDGDRNNLTIENLELITRKEHAHRNKTGFDLLPADLKTTIKLMNKLNKRIYEKQDKRFA